MFLKKNYPEYYNIYNLIDDNYGAVKADYWRYIIIYHYGGIYIDNSIEIYKKLDSVISKKDGLIITINHEKGLFRNKIWGKNLLWNWFFAAPPKNKILKQLIDTINNNIINYKKYLSSFPPKKNVPLSTYNTFLLTGPLIFDKIIKENKKEKIYKFI